MGQSISCYYNKSQEVHRVTFESQIDKPAFQLMLAVIVERYWLKHEETLWSNVIYYAPTHIFNQ